MGALDDGDIGCRPVTDLGDIAESRKNYLAMGYRLPLQDAERAAGLTDADMPSQVQP
ncbi:hypothetical protein ABIA30_003115 [Mycobacterium sp. MAA66]|uniref:hypothetical protein n=1 Tax=Mycobacterium sp. MAA66 TaxID=3156297 RepID=UPI0035126FDC